MIAQDLGGGPTPSDANVPSAGDAGHVPQPHVQDVTLCPSGQPAPGDACDVLPVQCLYAADDPVSPNICAEMCVCAFEARTGRGTWMCLKAACAVPARNTCREGFACLGDEHCAVDDTQCTCREDMRLHCNQVIQ